MKKSKKPIIFTIESMVGLFVFQHLANELTFKRLEHWKCFSFFFAYRKPPMITLIVAMTPQRVIGWNNQLLWYLPRDMQHFKRLTVGKPVVMGRKTFESIGKPLVNRLNLILSKHDSLILPAGCERVATPESILALQAEYPEICIIGGQSVYQWFLPYTDALHITWVYADLVGDAHFPQWNQAEFELIARDDFEADDRHAYAHSLTYWRRD